MTPPFYASLQDRLDHQWEKCPAREAPYPPAAVNYAPGKSAGPSDAATRNPDPSPGSARGVAHAQSPPARLLGPEGTPTSTGERRA